MAKSAQGRPIILAGNSLGGAVALYVASKRPAAAMILQNPPPLQRMILQKYGWIFPAPVLSAPRVVCMTARLSFEESLWVQLNRGWPVLET